MHRQEFNSYEKRIRTHLAEMLTTRQPHALDEQAVPSYTHKNPIIRSLFWDRVRKVTSCLERIEIGNVLDFGCGAGILLPFLRTHGQNLVAFDVDLSVAQEMIHRLELSGIRLLSDLESLRNLPSQSFDTILALDVLEHVENLTEICALFSHIIKPEGTLIVSGPTESLIYRLGRKLAGYRHHFHRRDIYAIEQELAQYFRIQQLLKLYPWITFFRISTWSLRV